MVWVRSPRLENGIQVRKQNRKEEVAVGDKREQGRESKQNKGFSDENRNEGIHPQGG